MAADAAERLGGKPPLPWWRQRDVQLTAAGYGLIAFLFSAISELTPIYASAPAGIGGLALSSSQFAGAVSFSGVVLVVYALFLYPRHQKLVGPLWCVRTGLLCMLPASAVIPLASLVVRKRVPAQVVLYIGYGLKACGQVSGLSCCKGKLRLLHACQPITMKQQAHVFVHVYPLV